MNKLITKRSLASKVWKGTLFLLFAVPGALLAVFSGIFLIASFFEPKERIPTSPIVFVLALLIGTFMTLLGLGKIKEWLYGLIFISIPLSFWLYALVNPKMIGGTWGFLLFIGGIAFLILHIVRKLYKKQSFEPIRE